MEEISLQETISSMTPADQQENQQRGCLTTSVVQMRLHPRPQVPSWEAVGVGVLGRWGSCREEAAPWVSWREDREQALLLWSGRLYLVQCGGKGAAGVDGAPKRNRTLLIKAHLQTPPSPASPPRCLHQRGFP